MADPIYVILIDGRPYRKDSAIRTYKTPERAEKEAQNVAGYWSYRDSRLAVAKFSADIVTEITVPPRSEPRMPCPFVAPTEVGAE